jgi:predicted ATP-dependent Lon-type protease
MFSYIDKESLAEEYVSVPEQWGGKLIPEGMGKPGHVYVVDHADSGMIGVLQAREPSRKKDTAQSQPNELKKY